MTLLAQIEEKIRSGMSGALRDTDLFVDDSAQKIGAEYLLTVNVAKELVKLNQCAGPQYKIYLERRTSKVASECMPPLAWRAANNFLKRELVVRDRHNVMPNGRVDIAVYGTCSGDEEEPVCVVEVKGFDPGRSYIVKDLKRNAQYFGLVGETGESRLKYASFAAMHSYRKSPSEAQVAVDLNKLRSRYHKYQAEVGLSPGVRFQISVDTIGRGQTLSTSCQDDHEIVEFEGNHHFIGVIVSYWREV